MAEGAQRPVRRRTLLVAAVGTLALPAAGCGIRLEDDAPRLPLVPTRTPVPAEAALVGLTRATAGLAELAAVGANVLEVEHERTESQLHIGEVEVFVVVETRGPDHAAEVRSALTRAGYAVTLG